jgi:hypothetical protein
MEGPGRQSGVFSCRLTYFEAFEKNLVGGLHFPFCLLIFAL